MCASLISYVCYYLLQRRTLIQINKDLIYFQLTVFTVDLVSIVLHQNRHHSHSTVHKHTDARQDTSNIYG